LEWQTRKNDRYVAKLKLKEAEKLKNCSQNNKYGNPYCNQQCPTYHKFSYQDSFIPKILFGQIKYFKISQHFLKKVLIYTYEKVVTETFYSILKLNLEMKVLDRIPSKERKNKIISLDFQVSKGSSVFILSVCLCVYLSVCAI